VLLVLALLGVIPLWVLAKIAEGIARQLREGVSPRAALPVFVFMVATLLYTLRPSTGTYPSIIVGFLSVCLSPWLFARGASEGEDTLMPEDYPQTNWRLCDPQLSTWGVWRTEIEYDPSVIDGTGDFRVIRESIHGLIRDWSFRSGWPYLGCRVLHVARTDARTAGPFSFAPELSNVYQITLGVGQGRERGWIRFGDGFVELQMERPAWSHAARLMADSHQSVIAPEPFDVHADESEEAYESATVLAGSHPLWDRWIDG
jgi:hypothetical protein